MDLLQKIIVLVSPLFWLVFLCCSVAIICRTVLICKHKWVFVKEEKFETGYLKITIVTTLRCERCGDVITKQSKVM